MHEKSPALSGVKLYTSVITNNINLAHRLHSIRVMRVVVPIYDGRLSPVFDAAKRFVVLTRQGKARFSTEEVRIDSADVLTKVQKIAALKPNVLICGAISLPAESMLVSAGVRVIPNTCGQMEKVVEAFFAGRLTQRAFLMPGCTGQRRRRGHRRRCRGSGRGG